MNTKTKITQAILWSTFFASSAFAVPGTEGHGGQGIVCPSPHGKSVQLYDDYEGDINLKPKSGPLDQGDATQPYLKQIDFVLDRLAKVDAPSAERFRKRAKDFESEMNPLNDAQMIELSDAHHLINPDTGCYTDQFAVQIFHLKRDQSRYLVNYDLWKIASESTKAALVLHEAIYRDAVDFYGQNDSDSTRYYNYMIRSSVMNGIKDDHYQSILTSAGFLPVQNTLDDAQSAPCLFTFKREGAQVCGYFWSVADQKYVAHTVGPISFSLRNGNVIPLMGWTNRFFSNAIFLDTKAESIETARLAEDTSLHLEMGVFQLQKSSEIQFYPDHVINTMSLKEPTQISSSVGKIQVQYSISFHPNGEVKESSLVGPQVIKVKDLDLTANGSEIKFHENGALDTIRYGTKPFSINMGENLIQIYSAFSFWPSGALRSAYVKSGQTLVTANGGSLTLKNGAFGKMKCYSINFNEVGAATSYDEKDASNCH